MSYLFLDACYEKVRLEGRIVDCAVLIAVGIEASGKVKRRLVGQKRKEKKRVVLRLMRESVLPSPHGRPQGVPVVHGGSITIDRHDYGGSEVSRQSEPVQRGGDKFGTIETNIVQILWGQFEDTAWTKNARRGFAVRFAGGGMRA